MYKSLAIASVAFFSATAALADTLALPQGFYIGAEVGSSWQQLKSGGYNTAGDFNNTGKDTSNKPLFGLSAGVERGKWRFDIAYSGRHGFDYTTHSLGSHYFYDSNTRINSLMGSANYSFYQSGAFSTYAGLGAGVSHINVKTSDGVVSGNGSDNKFAWKAELGGEYALNSNLRVGAGVRYVDFGKADISLSDHGGGDAGNFTAKFRGNEVFMHLRHVF